MQRRHVSRGALYEINRELDAAPHGAKQAVVERHAETFDVSTATLRRWIRNEFKPKKEAPGRPRSISDELLDAVWDEVVADEEMGLQSRRRATKVILDALARAGIDGATDASASGVNAALRRYGYTAERFVGRLQPEFALQIVHMDFSRSKYFQLYTHDGHDHILRVGGRHLQYKEEDATLRSWIVSIVDGYSRLCRARMYAATGEDATLALTALREFWTPNVLQDALHEEPQNASARHPMHHPARCLWMDRGAAGKTERFVNALDSVGIDVEATHGKGAQGKVERQFRTLWSAFELPLAQRLGQNATITLTDYNEALGQFLLEQAAWPHPRRQGTREEVYKAGLRVQLDDGSVPAREIDVDLFTLAFDSQIRTVQNDGCIQLDNAFYRVPERAGRVYLQPEMKLRVHRYASGEVVASVLDAPGEEPFFCEPAGSRFGGRGQDRRERTAERLRDSGVLRRPQHERLGTEPDADRLAPAAPYRRTKPALPTLPARTEPAEVSGPKEDALRTSDAPVLSGFEARQYVGRRLAPFRLTFADPEVQSLFGPVIETGVTRAQLDELLDKVLRRVA